MKTNIKAVLLTAVAAGSLMAAHTQINLNTAAPAAAPSGSSTYYHAVPSAPGVGQAVRIVESHDDTDYIVKVFPLKNPDGAFEIVGILKAAIDAERGDIRASINDETEEATLIVTAPDFQMPYIENAIERLDKKGVSFDNDGTETLVYTFKNRQGKDLADMIEGTMLSGYGDIMVDEDLNQVIINDTPTSLACVQEQLPKFDTPTRQVRIECEIVELEDSDDFNFGLALEAWKEALPESVDMTIDWNKERQGNNGSPDGWARTIAQNVQLSGMRPKAVANFINYLVRRGDAKVLSRPTLIVNNGKLATVESVDNVNYKGYNSDPENTMDKQAETGVIMTILPNLAANSMNLEVEASVHSLVGWTTGGLPIINHRNTSASVNARPNETITISGLRRDYVTKADERVPILGYIPFVGYLFRHEIDVKKSSEILILLTPCEVGKENAREHHLVDDIKNGEEDENAINKFVDRVILNKSL